MIVMKVMTQYLDELTKPLYSCHIHAYLSERGVTTALREFCEHAAGYRYVLKIDPTDFFGSIDRRILAASMSGIGLSKKLIKQTMLFITAPVIEDGKISKKETGIPQGLPIAPVLSNLYLHSFDLFLEQHHCVYIRYADDVVVFGDDYDDLALLYQEVVSFLSERLALSINHTKCGIDIPERITYLGYRFERNSNGIITTGTEVPRPVVNRSWSTSKPKGKNSHISIISDGILSKHDFALRFSSDNAKYDLPVYGTESINVFSDVVFDSRFLSYAAKNRITVNLFSEKGHKLGSFIPNTRLLSPSVTPEQLEHYQDKNKRLYLASRFVLGAIHNLRLNIRYCCGVLSDEPGYSAINDVEVL